MPNLLFPESQNRFAEFPNAEVPAPNKMRPAVNEVDPVPPLATAKVPAKVIVPDVVIGPPDVVKPVVPPETATLETVAPVEPLDANKVTTPELFFAYSFMSAMFKPSSPFARLPDVGTAEAVVL
jgi:hypothetical protein